MDIINRLDQRDQDLVLERLDFHIANGVPPKDAQRLAVLDALAALDAKPYEEVSGQRHQELVNAIAKSVDNDFIGITMRMQKDGVLEVNCE